MSDTLSKIKSYLKKRQLVKHSLFLFFLGGALKVFSLIREIVVANYYGTSIFKDGFVALIALFSIFYAPLMETVIIAIPKYLKEKQ